MSSFLTRLKITLGSANADQRALDALQPDAAVAVSIGKDIVLKPAAQAATTGIIFYPGGRCDPRAYAPVLRPLAEDGNLIAVPQMPLRLAVLGANRAAAIMAAHPDISRWVIGGHSMGGVMAAAFAFKNRERVAGLFFVGSYPASMHAMPTSDLPVCMVRGTRDFITRQAEVDAAPERLPAHTKFVDIEGGDHYQFGSFANGEHTATISRDEQQAQTISALREFVTNLR